MKSHSKGHPHREILLTLSGSHFYGRHGRIFRAEPGSVFLFDRWESHDSNYSPYQPDCRNLWLHLISTHQLTAIEIVVRSGRIQSGCSAADREGNSQRAHRYRPQAGALVESLTKCWDLCDQRNGESSFLAGLKAAVAMVFLHVLNTARETSEEKPRHSQQQTIVQQVQDYIRHHLGDDLSLGSLARVAGYEEVYFHRLFQKHTGENLRVYINRLRLERAQALLKEGRTVQSVAEELGFGTAAYFSRFFRNATGHPPAAWRERK
jgi:AraC-like DNA-binding protein